MICFLGKCGGESKLEWSYLVPEMRLRVKAKAKAKAKPEMTRKGPKLREVDGDGMVNGAKGGEDNKRREEGMELSVVGDEFRCLTPHYMFTNTYSKTQACILQNNCLTPSSSL
ncbi:Uncharacterized protein TCM_026829 [Theobroma cacao]|uniref:Uncharacterized protein n=1 Tax=Theobroma cacao TaxID=3641 RepID=A0A061F4D0_THECC|nr:Uncharacterized protein TCM_026829 [Theobroma cacao]